MHKKKALMVQLPSFVPVNHVEHRHSLEMEGEKSQPTVNRVAVVTGANKGIGLEIVKQLASNGVMVLLTARDVKRGTDAAEKLKDSGFADRVAFHQLDVADPASVATLAEFIKTQFGKLDILVNNAAVSGVEVEPEMAASIKEGSAELQTQFAMFQKVIATATQTYKKAEECLNINYYGTKRVTEALIPLLQLSQSPRVVNVSSLYGQLKNIPSESIQKEFSDVNGLTEEKVGELLCSFLNAIRQNKLQENGWPTEPSAYIVSKAAVNTCTRILASKYPNLCINSVHPGFVKTDITCSVGLITAEEGARCPVMLALLPEGSPSGLFYHNMEAISY